MTSSPEWPALGQEYDGVPLGDRRREARLQKIAGDLSRDPGKSFPELYEDDAAALAGLYRFCGNRRITFDAVARGHAQATLARCREAGEVLAVHDTTDYCFGADTERQGLGSLDGGGRGFYGHHTLMVTADPTHRPLGTVCSRLWVREPIPEELKGSEHRGVRAQSRPWEERESRRWKEQAEGVERLGAEQFRMIHVSDREVDDYDYFARMLDPANPCRFVARAKHNRAVVGKPPAKVREVVAQSPARFVDTVDVQQRPRKKNGPPKAARTHPPRAARKAIVEVGTTALELRRPDGAPAHLPDGLKLNVVWIHEVGCPEGEEPIDWLLYTSEPIETDDEVRRIICHYRGRWRIEEFFKALKTGCAFESRQLFTFEALTVALGIFLGIAWRLLLLRTLAQTEPEAPATAVLSPTQLEVLAASLKKTKLPDRPSVQAALLAVAALGGHLKHNGQPGWITLSRGYEKLLVLEMGWRSHRDKVRRQNPRRTRKRSADP